MFLVTYLKNPCIEKCGKTFLKFWLNFEFLKISKNTLILAHLILIFNFAFWLYVCNSQPRKKAAFEVMASMANSFSQFKPWLCGYHMWVTRAVLLSHNHGSPKNSQIYLIFQKKNRFFIFQKEYYFIYFILKHTYW